MTARIALLTVTLVALLAGCGGGGSAKTPRGVATAYVNLMAGGKYKEAALLWDYTTDARRQNEDWDNFPESQRKLIIGKLAEEKAQSLAQWSGHFSGNVKVVQVEQNGDKAKALLEGGRISSLDLVQVDDEWHIAAMNQ